mgnify:CR=1 FL=1
MLLFFYKIFLFIFLVFFTCLSVFAPIIALVSVIAGDMPFSVFVIVLLMFAPASFFGVKFLRAIYVAEGLQSRGIEKVSDMVSTVFWALMLILCGLLFLMLFDFNSGSMRKFEGDQDGKVAYGLMIFAGVFSVASTLILVRKIYRWLPQRSQ